MYILSFFKVFYSEPELKVVGAEVDVAVSKINGNGNGAAHTKVIAEEIDVQETVILADATARPWEILLCGTPSPKRRTLSIGALLLNIILLGLTLDMLYTPRLFHHAEDLSFVRLGYVSPTEAKFLIREPNQAVMPLSMEIRPKQASGPLDSVAWHQAANIKATSNDTDFTAVVTVPLRHSEPQQRYEWRTSNNQSGEFAAPPKPGSMPTDGKFTFLSTSCILHRFPYNPMDHALAIPGLRHLAKKLPDLGAQFMLFLGDFIYVDVPERFGKTVDEYRMQYRQVYASPDWPAVSQNLSWVHVLDDHEISNDWDANDTGVYRAAFEPWLTYQADVNPPKAVKAGTKSTRRDKATWFEFTQGPASFFMLDTRSYRSSNYEPWKSESKTMLGADQLEDFLAWLARPEPEGVKWKFVASSVPFTKNWPVNTKDIWGGFLFERKKVLEAMWDAGARGTTVVILSGDRHEFAATKFPPSPDSRWPDSAAAFEFSTSPLNQFASIIPTYKQYDDEDVKLK